jgi:RNA polymerase sigma factor (sigma-70 family)
MPLHPAVLLRHLRCLASPPGPDPAPDAALLERFADRRDQAAFAALVSRHGAMVLRVCRHVLGNVHDAEDCFQATFLVLARRAGTLRRPESLAGWLHGVALRVARKARARARLPRSTPPLIPEPADPSPDPLNELTVRELLDLLHEEIERLPKVERLPVVLCCLEGRTMAEAAGQLGWSPGSVRGRLGRGRARLHHRLVRRGITLPAGVAATLLAPPAALSAATQTALVSRVAQAGGRGTVSAIVAPLVQEGLRNLAWPWGKVGVVVLLAGVLAAGVGALAYPAAQEQPSQARAEQAAAAPLTPKEDTARTDQYGDPLPPGAVARLGTVRFRHGEQIRALALSPDGKVIASGGQKGRVCLWEVATGRRLDTLRGPAGQVLALGFSPDGRTLAAAGSRDFNQISAGQTVLWELGTRKTRFTLTHSRWARCLAFSPDGAVLAVGCDAQEFGTWDTTTGKRRERLQGTFPQGAAAAAFSPDGRLLATGGYEKAVKLWDWRTGKEIGRLDAGSIVRSLAFSPDNKALLTGQDGPQFVCLWDVARRNRLRAFQGHKLPKSAYFPGAVFSAAFSPDGRTIASGGDEGVLRLWDTRTGEPQGSYRNPRGWIHGVAFSPDGKTLVAGSTNGRLRLFDWAAGKELHLFEEHQAGVADFALSPDGRALASAGADETIRLWDLPTGRTSRILRGHPGGVFSVHFSPDGRELTSGGADGTVRIWEVATGRGRQLTDAHGWQSRAAFSPNGRILASCGADSKVRLWDSAGRELGQLSGHVGFIPGLAFSPDGKWLATSGESYGGRDGLHEDQTIRLWDVARRVERWRVTRSHPYRGSMRFSPDGLNLVFSDGGTLHFADVVTGKELRRPRFRGVTDFTFGAGGRWLVTVGTDGVSRFWELASGLELHQVVGPDSGVGRVAVAPGGRTLLTLNGDATILVWDLAPAGWRRGEGPKPANAGRFWTDLAASDGPTAYRTRWALGAEPARAVRLFRDRLPGTVREVAVQGRRVRSLIAELESDSFRQREKASRELAELGAEAELPLRLALAGNPSAEGRRRLEALLAKGNVLRSGELLRGLRVVEILEWIGTPEAQRVLETVVEGAPDTWLMREAKAALERLAHRPLARP